MAPTRPARGGSLLDARVFGGTPPVLDESAPPNDPSAAFPNLRVVAIRIDPCAGVTLPPQEPAACVPNIRLVFQQLLVVGTETRAADGALHAFFRPRADAFATFVSELRALRRADVASPPDVPLGVHPQLRREGVRGAYAQALERLVLRTVGPEDLVRVTDFRRLAPLKPPMWTFHVRERDAGQWRDASIPTLNATTQRLLTISGGRWDADATPKTAHPDEPTELFKVSEPREVEAALGRTARVLNPRVHSSESIDCASCHIAPDIAIFAEQTSKLRLASLPDYFAANLPAVAKDPSEAVAFENLHMVSYLGTSLSLASRTVNETAMVLQQLNAR
jgi:hypothetical protein